MSKVPSAVTASGEPSQNPSLTDTMTAQDVPTSFGTFKPIGHLLIGLPSEPQVLSTITALHDVGWSSTAVHRFLPVDSVAELKDLVSNASPIAGFGYEIGLLRRYLTLAEQGYHWLLVKVDNTEHAHVASSVAQAHGATLAVHYRTLTNEELI